jgi:thiamine-phosphate pyrophosphorylase
MDLPHPPLLVISDRSQARLPLIEVARAAFAGGCRWFSLREKDLPVAERRALLAALVELGQRFAAVVTVHEDIEAVACGAAGVHLPGAGDPGAARVLLPRGLIGASAHSATEAAAGLRAGADYVTVSPVFLTASKPGYGPALGLAGLAAAVAAAPPGRVLALGGVTADNAALCRAVGAGGIAVMGEVMRADNPGDAVQALIHAFSAVGTV